MSRMIRILSLAVFIMFASLIGMSSTASAENGFPSKNITWLIPSKPGGGFDIYSRAVGKFMQKYLPNKVDFIYRDVPAGGGIEAVTMVYKAKPDGYTIGIVKVPGSIVSQIAMPWVQYDVTKMTYIGTISKSPFALAVNKNSAYNSVDDLVKKGKIKFSTSGIGATSWANTVIFANELGIKASFVNYTSMPDSALSCIRGDSEAFLGPIFTLWPYEKSGDIKFLAVFSKERIPQMENVKTIGEEGYPELATLSMYRTVAGPPGLPENIRKILEEAFWKAVNDKGFVNQLQKANQPLIGPTKGDGAFELVTSAGKRFSKYKTILQESLKMKRRKKK